MTLTAVIAHGIGVYMWLADEGLQGGANWTIEVVPWTVLLSLAI